MSHQKTNKIESPLKIKHLSMLKVHDQQQRDKVLSSRIIMKAQKRKPIFEDVSRYHSEASRSSSLRKKIFESNRKQKANEDNPKQQGQLHFSKLFQTQEVKKKTVDSEYEPQSKEPLEINASNDTSQSSSIQSDLQLLNDVKMQLFPGTPIKKKSYQSPTNLEESRKLQYPGLNRPLFDRCQTPQKVQFLLMEFSVEKTVQKGTNNNSPIIYKEDQTIYRQAQIIQNPYNEVRDKTLQQTPIKGLDQSVKIRQSIMSRKSYQKSQVRSIKKSQQKLTGRPNISDQLRQLHKKLLQKNKACEKVNHETILIAEQNTRLKEQNQQLRKKLAKSSPASQHQAVNESKLRKLQNDNLYMKIKAEKARNMLESLLKIAQADDQQKGSIINLSQTIKHVIKQIEF